MDVLPRFKLEVHTVVVAVLYEVRLEHGMTFKFELHDLAFVSFAKRNDCLSAWRCSGKALLREKHDQQTNNVQLTEEYLH